MGSPALALIPKLTRGKYLAFATICAIWGTTWMAIRVVVRDVPPFRAPAIRFLLAALLLFIIVLAGRRKLPAGREQWRALIVLGVTMIGLPYGLIFWAEGRINSSLTAVLYSALPLFVAFLTPLVSRERVPRRAVNAMVWAVGGIAVLFYSERAFSSHMIAGGLAVVGAVISNAWASIYAKQQLADIDPFSGTAVQFAVAALILFGASLTLERETSSVWSLQSTLAMGFLIVFGSVIAFSVYYWLLKRMPAYQISTTSFIVPLIAIIEGALILEERVPPVMIVASLVVLVAVGSILRADEDSLQELGLRSITREAGVRPKQ
jgi:drug/metabolite transporter (DMT)-like permease